MFGMKSNNCDPCQRQMFEPAIWTGRRWGCLLLVFTVLLSGCPDSKSSKPSQSFKLNGKNVPSSALGKQSEQLSRVVTQVKSQEVTDWSVFETTVTQSLNAAWNVAKQASGKSSMTELISDWQRPEILDTIPTAYQDSIWFRNISDDNFIYTDAHYIQEQYWLSLIQQRLSNESIGGRFQYLTHIDPAQPMSLEAALQATDSQLSNEDAKTLAKAMKLFDWTTRNITGDPFFAIANEGEAQDQSLRTYDRDLEPSLLGIRGPGYSHYLWQTLSYGRGDTWEQGHLFLQLARHADLDACVLGVPDVQPTPLTPRVAHRELLPWSIGVLVGGKVYLFDPRLGIPLHHPKTMAILTLDQCMGDKTLLESQSLTPEESNSEASVYPFVSEDLKGVVAMLDYPLAGFSIRTKFLQDNLAGEDRLALYFSPTEVAKRFAEVGAIEKVELWALPLEINIFRGVVREAQTRSVRDQFLRGKLQWVTLNESYFDDFPMLRESRVLYLQGKFTPDETGLTRDCMQEFQSLRYSEEDLAKIETDRNLQKVLGLFQSGGQTAAEFRQVILVMKARMQIVRADAQMYLAMAHQELKNYSTSLNWLRLVKGYDSLDKWERHVLYLQGRNHEAMRNWDKAIEAFQQIEDQYESQRSPRDFGNILRVRYLKQNAVAGEPDAAKDD